MGCLTILLVEFVSNGSKLVERVNHWWKSGGNGGGTFLVGGWWNTGGGTLLEATGVNRVQDCACTHMHTRTHMHFLQFFAAHEQTQKHIYSLKSFQKHYL